MVPMYSGLDMELLTTRDMRNCAVCFSGKQKQCVKNVHTFLAICVLSDDKTCLSVLNMGL